MTTEMNRLRKLQDTIHLLLVCAVVTSGFALLGVYTADQGAHAPTILITSALLACLGYTGAMRLTEMAKPWHRLAQVSASAIYFTVAVLTVYSLGGYLWPSALLAIVVLFTFRGR